MGVAPWAKSWRDLRLTMRRGVALLVGVALMAALLPSAAGLALAATDQSAIVAIVNEDVISRRDLEDRINLIIATGNLENQPDVRQKIAPEVLRLLIDDRLKQQEARRLNITVNQRDVDRALTDVARQLNTEPSRIPALIESRGASMTTLMNQLETEIAWIKTVARAAGERSTVSEEEVDEEVARLRGSSGGTEDRVAEIFLPIDEASNEKQVQDLADRIVSESRGGASFAALARTFSQSATAESGGDLGWLRRGQLDARLETVIERLNPGEISTPVRTDTGLYILQLVNRRSASALGGTTTVLTLHQVVLPLPVQASQAQLAEQLGKAGELRANPKSCADFSSRGRQLGASAAGDLGRVDVDRLPPQVRQMVAPLRAGQVSEPIRTGDGLVLLMVCDRDEEALDPNIKAQVQRRIFEQRISAASRQLLRDLRRSALLDIRM